MRDLTRELFDALRKVSEECDYCYACDNHPTHGHAEDCAFLAAAELLGVEL